MRHSKKYLDLLSRYNDLIGLANCRVEVVQMKDIHVIRSFPHFVPVENYAHLAAMPGEAGRIGMVRFVIGEPGVVGLL